MKIKGYFLDGKSSQRHEALLELNNHNGIKLYLQGPGAQHIGQEVIMFDFDAIKIESRLANTAREITLADEKLFISYDNDGVDHLAKKMSPRNAHGYWLHQLESNFVAIFLSSVFLITLIYTSLLYGVPKSSLWLANNLPDVVESQFSEGLAILDHSLLQKSELSQSEQQALRALMAPYYRTFSRLNISLEFRSGLGANAFALPDGTLVFTDDFIKLAKNDDEILAVLFHEIGHLEHKHLLRRAIQASLLGAFILLITGELDTLDVMTGIPSLLLDLAYSREFETEADQFALEQMYLANISVDHFSVIMRRLADANEATQSNKPNVLTPILSYFSSHPVTENRLQRVLDFKEAHGIID